MIFSSITAPVRGNARRLLVASAALGALGLAGCSALPTPKAASATPPSPSRVFTPTPPPTPAPPADQAAIDALLPSGVVDVTMPPQPLPQMINTAFGDVLRVPYVVGPEVAAKTDIVALRSARGMSRRSFFRLVQLALQPYGVRAEIHDGVVALNTGPAPPAGPAPVTLAAKPQPETPQADRNSSQLFEAQVIQVDALVALMTDVMPQSRNLNFSADAVSNSVLVTGSPRDTASAVEMLKRLDQPRFAGVSVFRVQPVFWSADTLSRSLAQSLEAEGFSDAGAPAAARSVLVTPMQQENQVLVFAKDPAVLQRARVLAERLDQAASFGGGESTFIYQVQNTAAADLAALVTEGESGGGVLPNRAGQPQAGQPGAAPLGGGGIDGLGVSPSTSAGPRPTNGVGSAGFGGGFSGMGGGGFRGGRIMVDAAGNRIVYSGGAEAFGQLRSLLTALDTPLKQVLVEVTIAEVTLTDETRAGLEWFFQSSMNGGTLSGGTLGGLGLGNSGLSLNYRSGSVTAAFDAFASNNNVNILSRPRLVARTGSEASIQVGTDVPIITSQMNSPTQTGGSTDILQSIQYRQTGVILRIKPVVYGSDQINLEISQEVSSDQSNPNAAIGSPLILNRNVKTVLSLAEGATAVLGGLIDTSYTKGNSGVPLLKDVPLLGQAFRTDTVSAGKTELIVLVTPHIIRSSEDMDRWTRQYTSEADSAFRSSLGFFSRTLTPFERRKEMRVTPPPPPPATGLPPGL